MSFGVTQTGEGRPLVLLHGVGVDHTIWDPVLSLLVERRRAVAVDLPGFGASSPAGRGFDLCSVALRTADGLWRVGIEEPYDLLGQSLGGSVAVVLASERPSSVNRLVLGAPPGIVTGSWLRAQGFGMGTAALGACHYRELSQCMLPALSTPLGLIWGERDNTVKLAVAHEIQRIRPGTPLEVVAGSGHIPHVEAPDEFAAAAGPAAGAARRARVGSPG